MADDKTMTKQELVEKILELESRITTLEKQVNFDTEGIRNVPCDLQLSELGK